MNNVSCISIIQTCRQTMTRKCDEVFTRSLNSRGRHLWDEQQAEGDGHGQVSVGEEQHEHPVGVQPRHQGEPAEKQHTGDDPSLRVRKPDWNSSDSATGSGGVDSSTSAHLPACHRPQPVQLLDRPHTPPQRLLLFTPPPSNSSQSFIRHHHPETPPFPPVSLLKITHFIPFISQHNRLFIYVAAHRKALFLH